MIKGKTTGVINHEVFYVFKFSLTAVRTLWTVSRHEERKDKQCLTEHESVLNWIKLLLRMKYHDLMNYSKLRMMMMSRRKKTTHKLLLKRLSPQGQLCFTQQFHLNNAVWFSQIFPYQL